MRVPAATQARGRSRTISALPEERCDSPDRVSDRLPGSGTVPDEGADRNCAHPPMTRAAVSAAPLPSERAMAATTSVPVPPMKLSGLEPVVIGADALFINIGERTNVTGSKAFARLILNGQFE